MVVDPVFRNADQAVVSGDRHEPTGNVGARKLLHIEMIDEKSWDVRKTDHMGGLINEIVFVSNCICCHVLYLREALVPTQL